MKKIKTKTTYNLLERYEWKELMEYLENKEFELKFPFPTVMMIMDTRDGKIFGIFEDPDWGTDISKPVRVPNYSSLVVNTNSRLEQAIDEYIAQQPTEEAGKTPTPPAQ